MRWTTAAANWKTPSAHCNPARLSAASRSASDIYRDILALDDEFEEVEIDLDEHELSVTTDRIVLEDIDLGPFEIRLDWQRLGASSAYRVVALDPNPAARSDDVTHPHVQDEQLCEGEGRAAIRAALAEGRLYDFFLLVSQLLHTYGRGSAYVELDDWDGVPCDDCGGSVDEDDRYYCQRCGATLCGSCSVTCQGCGRVVLFRLPRQVCRLRLRVLLLLPGDLPGLPQAVLRGLPARTACACPVTKNNVTRNTNMIRQKTLETQPVAVAGA